jgi:predicted TIM-barrel fold metal-dependent hydrolase
MSAVNYRIVDADMHYYEPDDCFTRHLDPKFADRAVRIVHGDDGLGRVYFGDRRLNYMSVTPTDFTSPPGTFRAYLEGHGTRPNVSENLIHPRDFPELVDDRNARLAQMDEQGVEAAILLPTLGVTVEHDLRDDVEALYAAFAAFNDWVREDWGFGDNRRIFGVAVLSLVDADLAVAELERVLGLGARLVYLRAGPVYGRSPADPFYDRFWARLNEAEVPVIFHIGNSGYQDIYAPQWSEPAGVPSHRLSAFQHLMCQIDRPVVDVLAALVLQNLFGRFPKLRVISIENGSAWVPFLLYRMDKALRATWTVPSIGGRLEQLPSDTFRDHISVVPFFEDDVLGLVELIGSERVLLGSDFPHPEGVAAPLDFLEKLEGLSDDDVHRIARTNGATLLGLTTP